MDRLSTLLLNARDRLGCSGLRDLNDLAQMRQETLEKRIAGAQHRLTVRNTLSIYTAWLWQKTISVVPKDLHLVMEKWCVYLWGIGCTCEMAYLAWKTAQTTLGPPVTQSSPLGELHMRIGYAIANQFPLLSPTKRSFAALEDGAGSEEGEVADTASRDAPSPPAKKRKASHAGQGLSAAPFRQPVPSFPAPGLIGRGDFFSVSPRNKDPGSHSFKNAARRVQEVNGAPWTRDGFRFDFRHNPPQPSAGCPHWSPRHDVAANRERQAESRPPAQTQRVPIKMEERSPTPPPRVVSVGHAPVQLMPAASQMQKQMHKTSWQINNVQNQLKNASNSVPLTKPAATSKMPGDSAKQDEAVVHMPKQTASAASQAKQTKPPLPTKPSAVDKGIEATKKKSLSRFGTPEGVFKPANNEIKLSHQSCIPSAPTVPVQHNADYQAQLHTKYYAQIHPQRYSLLYSQPLSQHQAATSNTSEARVAPYPRMHNSPVPQRPVLIQEQVVEKPVLGYHPSVTRLFVRRPNVWVHQTARDVALDMWEDFSDLNRPYEYWAWGEYDPFNPVVWDMNGRMQRQAPGA